MDELFPPGLGDPVDSSLDRLVVGLSQVLSINLVSVLTFSSATRGRLSGVRSTMGGVAAWWRQCCVFLLDVLACPQAVGGQAVLSSILHLLPQAVWLVGENGRGYGERHRHGNLHLAG